MASMMAEATMPRPGPAKGVVPKKGIGMVFGIAGEPGIADMVKVEVPTTIAAASAGRGMSAARNKRRRHRRQPKKATNRLTPP